MGLKAKIVLVGEGSSEPTAGFETVRAFFAPAPVHFVFGVRRSPEGLAILQSGGVLLSTTFPGRGLKVLEGKTVVCRASAYGAYRLLERGRIRPDALLVVASSADASGKRTLGTANGPLQCAIDVSPLLFIEENPHLVSFQGAAVIPAAKPAVVLAHGIPPYAPLSRRPDHVDRDCARNAADLIVDHSALQLGVGGVAEALAECLTGRKGLGFFSGAVGASALTLLNSGALAHGSFLHGSAVVGNEEVLRALADSGRVRLHSSAEIHNPGWLAKISRLIAVNGAVSVDLLGNVNAEQTSRGFVSGRGGAPDFARGASRSPAGLSIIMVRTDRPGGLVERLEKPSIHQRFVSHIVTDKGIADIRGVCGERRAARIRSIF